MHTYIYIYNILVQKLFLQHLAQAAFEKSKKDKKKTIQYKDMGMYTYMAYMHTYIRIYIYICIYRATTARMK